MKRVFIFFLWIFLLAFVLSSLYISMTDYLYTRDTKILRNVVHFLEKTKEGEDKVRLPHPDMSIFIYSDRQGNKLVSDNVRNPGDRGAYLNVKVPLEDGNLYAYLKKVDPIDYLIFVSQNPFYTGLLVASLLLYITIFYFTLRELQVPQRVTLTEDLINRLKALRLTLATLRVIPEESVDELKRIVDSIIFRQKVKR
ncbi:MAG: hypothetical protein Q9N26_07000 [Aquificota bacterium]|nr:hypothetical protein [Aquificota bacterium]